LLEFQMEDYNAVCTPTFANLKLKRDLNGKKVDFTLYKQIVGKAHMDMSS